MDWTRSPYVAAYFAFSDISNKQARSANADQAVRIFIFDIASWERDVPSNRRLHPMLPFLKFREIAAMDNDRTIPQQGVSAFTNVDNIEAFVKTFEDTLEKKYLRMIDLPKRSRPNVMRDLRMMGITEGSLFPGLDGACAELRERFFED